MAQDRDKTKKELLDELKELRKRVRQSEKARAEKRVARPLKSPGDRYRTLFDSCPGPLWICDLETLSFLAVNRAAIRHYGYSRDEFLSMTTDDISLAGKVAGRCAGKTKRVKVCEETIAMTHRKKDGTVIDVELTMRPIVFEGKRAGLVLAYDVTKCRIVEKTLAESEGRFRAIFDGALDGMLVADSESKMFVMGNRTMSGMLGYTEEEIGELGVTDIHPAEHVSFVMETFERQAKGEFSAARDVPVRRKDGSVFYADINSSPIIIGGRKCLLGIFRDITVRKQAEEELSKSEERYRMLVETSPDVIFSLSPEGKMVSLNPAFEKLTGWSLDECIDRPFQPLVHPDDLPLALEMFRRVMGGAIPPPYELRILSKSGEYLSAEFVGAPLVESGKVVGKFGIARDITERTRTEKTLLRAFSLLSATLDSTADGILVVDREGKIISFNNKFLELWRIPGYVVESHDDDQAIAFVLDQMKDPEGFLRKVKELYASPDAESFDTLEFKDGRVFERYSKPQKVGEMVVGRVWSFRDVTEKTRAEKALGEQKLFAENLILNSAVATFVLDTEHKIVFWNKACEELTGMPASEMVGTDNQWKPFYAQKRQVLADIIIDGNFEDIPVLYSKYAVPSLQKDGWHSEGWYMNLNGRDRYVIFDAAPIYDKGGVLCAVVETLQDITERREAEQALQEKEERLRIIFEASQAGIILVDPRGTITFANERMAEMFGCGLDELIGSPYPDHVHPSERGTGDKKMRQLIAGEISYVSTERHYVRKDGSDFWGYLSGRRLEDPDGRLRALVGIIADITESKTAKEKIFRITRDWEDTFNSLTDMVTIHDKDFNIVQFNRAAEKILKLPDLSVSKVIKCYEYFHGKDCPPAGCPSCDSLKTGQGAAFELFEPHLNMFIEVRAIPRFDSSNNLIGLIHVVRDITERKKSEEYIALQLERMTALRSIDMAISSTLDLRVTLHILLEQVVAQLKVDAADILMLDPQSMFLNFAAGRGFRSRAVEKTTIRLGQGYAGRAALEHRTISIPNLSTGEERLTASLQGEGFNAYFAVPLIAKGQVKGVLEIFHRSPFQPDGEWTNFLEVLGGQAAIAVDNVSLFDNLQRSHSELTTAYDTTIEGWSRALDYRDKETEGHSQRVTDIAVRIAGALGLHAEDLVGIRRGALLHDIGKLGVPDNILLKPGKLTDEEWMIMKRHPEIAFELLSPIAFLRPATDIPYCHHEKWDGSGYPRGLKGEQIPLAARIFAVVDVWDALCSDRPYRPAWPEEKVLDHLRAGSGTHFDPKIVEVFVGMRQTRKI